MRCAASVTIDIGLSRRRSRVHHRLAAVASVGVQAHRVRFPGGDAAVDAPGRPWPLRRMCSTPSPRPGSPPSDSTPSVRGRRRRGLAWTECSPRAVLKRAGVGGRSDGRGRGILGESSKNRVGQGARSAPGIFDPGPASRTPSRRSGRGEHARLPRCRIALEFTSTSDVRSLADAAAICAAAGWERCGIPSTVALLPAAPTGTLRSMRGGTSRSFSERRIAPSKIPRSRRTVKQTASRSGTFDIRRVRMSSNETGYDAPSRRDPV